MPYQPEQQNSAGRFPGEAVGIFQAVAEMSDDGILVLGERNRIEFANAMGARITGIKQGDVRGRNFSDLLDQKSTKKFAALKKVSETSLSKIYQTVTLSSTFSGPVCVEIGIVRYPAGTGEGEKFIVYFKEITARDPATKALRESENKYRSVFEQLDQGVCITSREGRFLDCNPALLAILGYESKEEFLEMDITADLYVNSRDRKSFQDLVERDGFVTNYEVEFKKKNGETIPVLMTAHGRKNEKGEVIGYQGIIIDISDRIRMEQELREKHGFLSKLLESSVDCIVATDMKGTVIFFNKAAKKLTGYRELDVIGRFHITQFYSGETARDIMRLLRSEGHGGIGKLDNLMLMIRDKENVEIPVNLSASIVYEGQKEIASLGIFQDLRDKIKIERALQETQVRLLQSEKMASLGSLSAGVAHEINNPLGGILIYASLLLEDFEEQNDPRVADLKRIVDEAGRCKEIVKSLLEFGRQTESCFETVDVNKCIIDGLFFLENQVMFHDIRISKKLDFSIPLIEGDPNQMKQVFMNMMVNAAEAMADGGGLLIIKTGISPDHGSVFMAFQDTGPGIPHDIQSKIFDPFFTTKEVGKGTGLGLSTSYGIIQSHHGTIELASEPGQGAVFTILLPIAIEKVS